MQRQTNAESFSRTRVRHFWGVSEGAPVRCLRETLATLVESDTRSRSASTASTRSGAQKAGDRLKSRHCRANTQLERGGTVHLLLRGAALGAPLRKRAFASLQ